MGTMDNTPAYESGEYVTFHVTARDGRDVEMAVVDEFKTEGQYIYQCHIKGDDFTVEPILDPKEFERVSRAYMKL